MSADQAYVAERLVENAERVVARAEVKAALCMLKCGDWRGAECLLAPNGRLPSDSAALDLLARIAARRGQYNRALELWTAAAAHVAPSAFEAERRAAIRLKAAPWRRWIPHVLVGLLVAVFGANLWVFAAPRVVRCARGASVPSHKPRLTRVLAVVPTLGGGITDVTSEVRGSETMVVVKSPVFTKATLPSSAGRSIMVQLGRELNCVQQPCAIVVVGQAVPGELGGLKKQDAYVQLEFDRAKAALAYLTSGPQAAKHRWSLASGSMLGMTSTQRTVRLVVSRIEK